MSEYIERTSEIILAANAGARAIENTERYHGAFYTRDVFADNSAEIAYLQAAKVLRDIEDAPAADVAPVVHGRWKALRIQNTRRIATTNALSVAGGTPEMPCATKKADVVGIA